MSKIDIDINIAETADLVPYENNPRHNEDAVKHVAKSIKQFGFKVPIVIDKDFTIVAGHTRWLAAQKLKMTEVPVIVADDLTPEQLRAFRLADNRTAEYSTWDEPLLAEEIAALDEAEFDLRETGFNDEELAYLLEYDEEGGTDDVSVTVKSTAFVTIGVGAFKIKWAREDFEKWEKHALGTFGTKNNVKKELLKRLGILDFIEAPSSALNLKLAIEAENEAASKKKTGKKKKAD